MASVEVSVLGGLMIEVEYEVFPAEPDVGLPSSYVDQWSIVGINGKRKKNTDWILKRMSKHDDEAVSDACHADAFGW